MDDEERDALEMTKDELLARAARGVPLDGARSEPKSRNREDFAQRMHRVVGETIEKSERESVEEDPRITVFPFRMRAVHQRQYAIAPQHASGSSASPSPR